MGKLLVKQKVLSFRDRFYVTDEFGETRYYAEGAIFSLGKKCAIYDNQGREAARIEQRVWSWLPTFLIWIQDVQVASIQKKWGFLRPRYHVDFGDIEVKGDMWGLHYQLISKGNVVGSINKKLFKLADTYEIEVLDDQLEVMVLALVLSIDFVMAMEQSSA